jgi:hypothetical protein
MPLARQCVLGHPTKRDDDGLGEQRSHDRVCRGVGTVATGTERLHIGPGRPCRARARRRPAPAHADLPALIALVFAGAALLAVSLTCLGIGLLTA